MNEKRLRNKQEQSGHKKRHVPEHMPLLIEAKKFD
jgi:hypothetical protein